MASMRRNFRLKTGTMSTLLVTMATLGSLSGCNRADEADCDQAYEKWIDLRTKGEPEAIRIIKANKLDKQRPRFLSECVGKTPKSVINCWLQATQKEELERCE